MTSRSALIRLIIVNASTGAMLGVALALAMLVANSSAMGRLIVADEAAAAPLALLLASFAALGSAALTSSAIMALGDAGPANPRGGGRCVPARLVRRGP